MADPVVIFVPGFMQRGDSWAPVAGAVGERYPSACLDFRSHSFESRLGELREAAAPGTVPIGYSMGGRLVLHLAAREPDRFAGLATVGASPGIDDPGERDQRYITAARRIALLAPRGDARPVMGAGHAAHLEQPAATAQLLLEFLDQHLGEDVVGH